MMLLTLAALPFFGCTRGGDDSSSPSDSEQVEAIDTGFIEVSASTFEMGCTAGQTGCSARYESQHTVTLTHDYYMGATEVTQGQFEAAMQYNPSYFSDCGEDCPVEQVSWHEAAAYANAVSAEAAIQQCYACTGTGPTLICLEEVDPYECEGYRLPTEAEWEGAARSGTDLLYSGSNICDDVAWTAQNSGSTPHPVAGLARNDGDLYDMSGNVWEWNNDGYGTYGSEPVTDPEGDSTGCCRNVRGGAWSGGVTNARVSIRYYVAPDGFDRLIGFRIARAVQPE